MEDKIYSIYFLAWQKERFKKKKSFTRYYPTDLRFLEGFLITTTIIQRVRFH